MVLGVGFHGQGSERQLLAGSGEIIIEDARDCFALSDHGCVALVGVENLVVVAMQDAVLVASKDHVEHIKRVVERLKGNGGDLATQPGAPAVGLVSRPQSRRPLSGQVHHGEAWWPPVATEPLSSLGAIAWPIPPRFPPS